MSRLTKISVGMAGLALGAVTHSAMAANFTINWLDMSPTPFGTSVPNNSVFNLAGIGQVTVTYSIPSGFTDARGTNAFFDNGSVQSGMYSWSNYEWFGTTNHVASDPVVTTPWRITYTFANTVNAGDLVVGVVGLGSTTSFGGGDSTATVNQNGAFLGDFSSGGNFGPTMFTGGVGTFTMQNSLSAPGGADPHWNTPLGVVLINDSVSSITVDFAQLSGDGVGVNIGAVVPPPGALATMAVGGLVALRRRR